MRTLDLRNMLIEMTMPTVERDMLEVTRLFRPDPNWVTIDKFGHTHRWVKDALPTLEEVTDTPAIMGIDEYGEEFEDIPAYTHYECKQCGERIEPGYMSDDSPQFIPALPRPQTLEIIPKSEKIQELFDIFDNNEEVSITFLDGINPIIGRVTQIDMIAGADIRVYIRRTK